MLITIFELVSMVITMLAAIKIRITIPSANIVDRTLSIAARLPQAWHLTRVDDV